MQSGAIGFGNVRRSVPVNTRRRDIVQRLTHFRLNGNRDWNPSFAGFASD